MIHECIQRENITKLWGCVTSIKDKVNDSKVWKVGFWIIVFLFVTAIPTLIGAIVVNDRLRQAEDQRIENQMRTYRDEYQSILTNISGDIREIKVLLKRNGS